MSSIEGVWQGVASILKHIASARRSQPKNISSTGTIIL